MAATDLQEAVLVLLLEGPVKQKGKLSRMLNIAVDADLIEAVIVDGDYGRYPRDLYDALGMLEFKGWVHGFESDEGGEGYEITDAGRQWLHSEDSGVSAETEQELMRLRQILDPPGKKPKPKRDVSQPKKKKGKSK